MIKELNEKQSQYLNMIVIEEIKGFTYSALREYSSEALLEEANKVSEVIIGILKKKHLIQPHSHQSFVDILLSAALLHNIFYDKDDWTTIYDARKLLSNAATENHIDPQVQEALFATIEAQLGDDTPVGGSRPKPGTPTEVFANAVWFVETYLS